MMGNSDVQDDGRAVQGLKMSKLCGDAWVGEMQFDA